MKNYYLIVLLLLVVCVTSYGQQFEFQLVHTGAGVMELQARETSGTGTPTTSNFVTDIGFGIRWSRACGSNINISSIDATTAGHANYDIAASNTRQDVGSGADYIQTFRSLTPPFNFPETWTTNTFVTLATLQVSQTGMGTCDFCLETMNVPSDDGINTVASQPNMGVDLTDYLPTITNGKVTAVPLPVELLSFNATSQNTHVDLAWKSAAEIDFDGYWLERSEDGKTFKEVVWIDGKGSSVSASSYDYQDKEIEGGKTYYYRLAMHDLDGSMEHSEIEAVKTYAKYTVEAFPKPTRDFLNVHISSEAHTPAKVHLVDICGRVIYEELLEVDKGDNEFILNGNGISNGVYMLIIRGDTWQHAEEVVFIK